MLHLKLLSRSITEVKTFNCIDYLFEQFKNAYECTHGDFLFSTVVLIIFWYQIRAGSN